MTGSASNNRRPRHIIRKVLIALIIAIFAIIVGCNIYIRVTYSTFYSEAKAEFPVPDTHSGFVVQDLDHIDKADIWLFSGYMHNSNVAPIIKRDSSGIVSKIYVELLDGQLYGMHHGSGITSTDDYTYLTTDNGYLVMRTDDFVNAQDGDTVEVIAERELGLGPAFLSISNDVLYTGEFYYPESYETPLEHRMVTPDGTPNPAIMYAFDANPDGFYGFSEVPDRIYSIPANVQGVCVTSDDKMVLSCSWGISNSKLRVYDLAQVTEDGTFTLSLKDALGDPTPSPYEDIIGFNQNMSTESQGSEAFSPAFIDIPLYYLDSASFLEDVIAPPMSEGITIFDGRVYIPNESASNKYLFGKFLLGADMIYSLAI